MANKRGNAGQPLPLSDRDDDHMQGHWLLARLGKRVLRPGGVELTRTLLARAEVTDADVLELAPGLGRTAAEILARNPRSYVGRRAIPTRPTWSDTFSPAAATSGSPTRPIPDYPTPAPMSSSARRC